MINKTNLHNLVLFSSAICNLNCKYCFIHKSKYLKEIDDIIIKNCNSEYYKDFLDKLSPYFNYDKLHTISLWGSEPSFGFSRFSSVIRDLFIEYPTLYRITFSSNFCNDNLVNEIKSLTDVVYPVCNNLQLDIQISIDGPAYINDINRGNGVTEKIEENFKKVLEFCKKLPHSIITTFSTKSTLTIEQIDNLTKNNKIKEYFDYFYNTIYKYNRIHDNIIVQIPYLTPTLPYYFTQEDGKTYAKFIEKVSEYAVESKFNIRDKFDLTSFPCRIRNRIIYDKTFIPNGVYSKYGFCGLGIGQIGLLPNHYLALCHREFSNFLEKFVNDTQNFKHDFIDNRAFSNSSMSSPTMFSLKDAETRLGIIRRYKVSSSTTILNTLENQIRTLAMCGQINEEYREKEMARFGANFILESCGICAKDAYDITGICSSSYNGMIKLILNGVDKVVLRGTEYEF